MTDEIAKLVVAVDATDLNALPPKLDAASAAGAKLDAQTGAITASAKELATALAATGNDLTKATALLGAQADAAGVAATATAQLAAVQGEAAQLGATATAAAAQVIATANQVTFQSFAAARAAALNFGAGAVEAETAAAEAAVAGAEVTVAAHAATTGSSTVVRESLVLLREASVGNFTRMAGSASILIGALGLLNTVLIPLVAIGAVLGAVFLTATDAINNGANGTGDLTRGLGLTAEQMDKVKDKTVTLGDTFKATFQVLGKDLAGEFAGGISEARTIWDGFVAVMADSFEYIVGLAVGAVRLIEEAWKILPTFLGGEGSAATINFTKAFEGGMDDAKKSIDKFFSDVGDKARDNALTRILKEAGNAPKDGVATGAATQILQLNEEAEAQEKLNNAVLSGNETVAKATEAAKENGQIAREIAKIQSDTKLSTEQQNALITALTEAQKRYNASLVDKENILAVDKTGDQITLLQKETDVIGLNERARISAIATLRAEQEANDRHYNPAQTEAYVQGQVALANAQLTLKQRTDSYNASLTLQAKLYAEIDSAANKSAQGMANAFGSVGTAIGGMGTALTGYAAQQAAFAVRQDEINKQTAAGNDQSAKQIILTQQQGDASDQFYANELDSVKGMFDTKSGIYKALNAAEGIYNAINLANSVARVAASIFETGVKVAGVVTTSGAQVVGAAVETSTTTVSVTNAATQASAWGVTAIAKAIASLPFPLDLIAGAAVAAALVGFGVAVFGGGGSGGGTATDDALNGGKTAKDRQAAQGSGTVLGDAAAKSDSIAQALTAIQKDTNTDLEYSNQMVVSLRAIQSSIGSVAASLSYQLGTGGALNTSNLGLGTTSGGGFLGLFASTTTKVLQDEGVNIAAQTVAAIKANGITGNTYQQVQTTKTNSGIFGLFGSSKTSSSTSTAPLSGDVEAQISNVIAGLANTVLDAATKLGVSGAQATIDAFTVSIGNISLAGLSGTDIQNTLNQVFGAIGDQLAAAAVPQVTALQQVGEGALTTLARLVNEYSVVTDVMKVVGGTFNAVGLSSLAARDRLVQLSGGLDQFTSQANFFSQNFLTSAQAIAPIAQAVAAQMSALGYSSVTTKAQFASLVQGIDTSTASGAQLYATLMNVAPAFAKVADSVTSMVSAQTSLQIKLLQAQGDALGATALQRAKDTAALDASLQPLNRVINATTDLSTAYSTANTALNNTKTTFADFAKSLTDYGTSLSVSASTSDPLRAYALAKSNFQTTASAAASGDQTALGNLQAVSTAFLTASGAAATTSKQAATDLASVKAAVTNAAAYAQGQVDIAQQQLDALDASVAGLLVLNQSVLSVVDAITALQGANDNLAIPGHAGGLSNVPYNNYLMRAHQGEAVLTGGDAAAWRAGKTGNNSNDDRVVAELRQMRADMKIVNNKIEYNTARVAKFLFNSTSDGASINTKAV